MLTNQIPVISPLRLSRDSIAKLDHQVLHIVIFAEEHLEGSYVYQNPARVALNENAYIICIYIGNSNRN